jgi:2-amino-4-hydroxy-6-hydroxymethyldihydropteridine diphosphokinase
MTDILLSLGSNLSPTSEAEAWLQAALRTELPRLVTELRCSSLYATSAEGSHARGTYVNCVVAGRTALTEAELEAACKQLEVAYGRTPEDKLVGRVPLDVDLVRWGDRIVRPKNWAMHFMQRGLRELNVWQE